MVLLTLLLAGFFVELVVREVANEPYPGVFQPRFGVVSPSGTAVVMEPTVVATYDDGSRATFHHRDVMAASKAETIVIFRSAFGPGSPRRGSAETIAWLGDRLAQLHHDIRPREAVIGWDEVTYSLAEDRPEDVRTVDRYHVDFGAQRD
jgi:hypothetical protein